MNEKGITLLETVLSTVILSLLVLTLLPSFYKLEGRLHNEKLAYRASEAAVNGIKEAAYTGVADGMITIEGMDYYWQYGGGEICVAYSDLKGPQRLCINAEGKRKVSHL